MAKTVVQAQLQFAALREDEHQRREARLLAALDAGRTRQGIALESFEPSKIDARVLPLDSEKKPRFSSTIPLLQTVRSWLPGGVA
jgi:hypothetical protein